MPKVKSLCFMLASVAFLTGCEEKLTFSYLIQNPAVLQREMNNCMASSTQTSAQKARCDMVAYAASQLPSLINEIQENPEALGQKILDQQMVFAKMKVELTNTQQALTTLQKQKAQTKDIQAAQDKLKQIQKAYDAQQENIQLMLAVAGLASPQ